MLQFRSATSAVAHHQLRITTLGYKYEKQNGVTTKNTSGTVAISVCVTTVGIDMAVTTINGNAVVIDMDLPTTTEGTSARMSLVTKNATRGNL